MRIRVLATGFAMALVAGCSLTNTPCPDAGRISTVNVLVSRDVGVDTGTLQVKVCDDAGCAESQHGLTSSTRNATTTLEQLGRSFDPYDTEVEVTVLNPQGLTMSTNTRAVAIDNAAPNAQRCDDSTSRATFQVTAANNQTS